MTKVKYNKVSIRGLKKAPRLNEGIDKRRLKDKRETENGKNMTGKI